MNASFSPSEPLKVFISYASKDGGLVDAFKPYLEGLERQKLIKTFYGSDTDPGLKWREEIRKQINSAQLILLLVSTNFLASECCYDFELKLAMERSEMGRARVVSILLSTSNWMDTELREFQVLPKGGQAVDTWKNPADAFVNITHEMKKVVKQLKDDTEPSPTTPEITIKARRTIPAGRYAMIVAAVLITLASLFSLSGHFPWPRSSGAGEVTIAVTDLPPYDPRGGSTSHGYIAGTVSGAKWPEFSVVIYSFTTAWYVQPSTDDPETMIQPDGRWSADIKTGARYTVLLVPRNYQPPSPITTNPARLTGVITSIEFEGKR